MVDRGNAAKENGALIYRAESISDTGVTLLQGFNNLVGRPTRPFRPGYHMTGLRP